MARMPTHDLISINFKSSVQGEVQGIGFDDDNLQQPGHTFTLYGSQEWGFDAFRYTIYAPEWKHFRIPVGDYYSGAMRYVFFINDQDASNPTSNSYFKNLSISEQEVSLPVMINFCQYAISPYYSPLETVPLNISVEDNGNTLHLSGNGWTQISMPIKLTGTTVVEFDFKSGSQGEVQGIGFDSNQMSDPGITFQLYGTQSYGLTVFNDYAGSAPGWKHYVIPVGHYYTGPMLYLFFSNDHDVADPTAVRYCIEIIPNV